MTEDEALNALAHRFGILPSYHALSGEERRISPDTQRALLRANGVDAATGALIRDALALEMAREHERMFPAEVVVESGAPCALDFGGGAEWHLTGEGAGPVLAEGRCAENIVLPPLPPGVHDLVLRVRDRSESVTVLAAPTRLPSVEEVTGHARLWGLNAALYGLRSGRNAGVGDYEDLARLGEIAAEKGAAFIGINPVHAMGASDRQAISPYSPSHRGYLATSHIALDGIPGLKTSDAARAVLDGIGPDVARLRDAVLVPYAAHRATHGRALEALYRAFCAEADPASRAAFADWCAAAGPGLSAFAAFEAATEDHGPDWRVWSAEIRRQERSAGPDSREARTDYHRWLQWVADRQIAAAKERARGAGMPLGLYLDLAVGARRGGAETWCEADAIAHGVSIGAPPDHLSPEGQTWDLAAFAPRRLQAQRYAPFRRVLAGAMRHAGLLRIDHVLGLARSFWVPDDGSPGGYVRQPFDALVALIKIEAMRAGTVIVGEDLGLVPEGFRAAMRGHGFYGYSVLQYERGPNGDFRDPAESDTQVLACFGTHDTPTLRGFAEGRDIGWWRRLGWIDEAEATINRARREADIVALAGIGSDRGADVTRPDHLSRTVHQSLASSPAALVAVQLDDVLDQAEAQNLPGTVDEHPNWRRRYDVPLEALGTQPAFQALAGWMGEGRRAAGPTDVKEV